MALVVLRGCRIRLIMFRSKMRPSHEIPTTREEFSEEVPAASWWFVAAILMPAALTSIALILARFDLSAFVSVCLVLVALTLAMRFSTKNRRSLIEFDAAGIRFATIARLAVVPVQRTVLIPWTAIEPVRLVETRQMPFIWRVLASLWGYAPGEAWVEMRAKETGRAHGKSVRISGIGFPPFHKLIYARPAPLTFFVDAVNSHLQAP